MQVDVIIGTGITKEEVKDIIYIFIYQSHQQFQLTQPSEFLYSTDRPITLYAEKREDKAKYKINTKFRFRIRKAQIQVFSESWKALGKFGGNNVVLCMSPSTPGEKENINLINNHICFVLLDFLPVCLKNISFKFNFFPS